MANGKKKPKLPRAPIPKPTKIIPNKKSAKIADSKDKEISYRDYHYEDY